MAIEINAQNVIKNASYNMLGYIWPMFFSLFITPIIVFKLGIRDYGIYIFLNTLLSLMGLLDLGIATSALKHITEYNSTDQKDRLKNFIYTINSIFLIIGLVGLGIFIILGLIPNFFFPGKLTSDFNPLWLFIIMGITFLINSISSTFSIILSANQRYDIGSKVSIIFFTISNLGTLALVYFGYKLTIVLSFQMLVVLFSAFTFNIIIKNISGFKILKYLWDKKEIINSYKYGFSVLFTNLAGSSLTYLDRLIIPLFVGPSMLTYYSLPGNISQRIPGISNTLSTMMFPLTVSLNSTENKDRLNKLYIRSFRLLAILAGSISITIICYSDVLLRFWLSEDFANRSQTILIILTLTGFLLALQGPLTNFLIALGKMKFVSISSITMAIINALALLILLPRYGITGAAWAYFISILPIIFMFSYTEKNFLKISIYKNHVRLIGKIILTSIPLFLISKFILKSQITNMFTLLVVCGFSFLLFFIFFKLFGFFEKEDDNDFKKFVYTTYKKIICLIK